MAAAELAGARWRGSAARQAVNVPPGVGVPAAMRAWAVLVERHEILRTVFWTGADHLPIQVVLPAEGFRLPVSVMTDGDEPEGAVPHQAADPGR